MPIIAYRKHITRDITRELLLPEDAQHQRLATELATVEGVTYVHLPEGIAVPLNQPPEIVDSIETVTVNAELREKIANASPHVRLIRQRVADKIAEHYSTGDEIKLLRTAPSAEFEVYNAYVEDCRQWGREAKAALGL